ncbi:hypothetical protein [Halomonas marinisediminis]|uniref:ABC transmembrane type-1 domain-containing protein n=1 Tax=Halomonas marinisediminis TaxID=2546095 RepID=A0ABY2D3U7_9GAMM|nr:hypothetical protein [Halomonas marinisediminis]TDA95479.1 hypothetical protein E0702_15335 [Halomonas marinisediminis]
MQDSTRWGLSLGLKFLKVVPFMTMTIVILTILSQIATLLSFFLPLKIVILLGSDGVPMYFPPSFSKVDRDILIIALSIATIGFFLLQILLEKIIQVVTNKATLCLLKRSHKMTLFENQEEIAEASYQRYSRALASGVFVLLSLLLLLFIYSEMVLVLTSYILIMSIILVAVCEFFEGAKEVLANSLSSSLRLMGGVGFFVSFAFLVVDFVYLTPPVVIFSIISLLLSRQVLNRVVKFVLDIAALYRQKTKLNAIFFHGKSLQTEQSVKRRSVWDLLEFSERSYWVSIALSEVLETLVDPKEVQAEWLQSTISNVAMLKVSYYKNSDLEYYLIKIYEVNRTSFALHESTLLASQQNNIPAFLWIGGAKIAKFYCSVYEFRPGKIPSPIETRQKIENVRLQLLKVELNESLVNLYTRSKPFLWQRVNEAFLKKLYSGVDGPEQLALVDELFLIINEINARLSRLPLILVNQDVNRESLWIPDGDDDAILLNWGRWSIEPIGASWPHDSESLDTLFKAIESGKDKRKDFLEISLSDVAISSILYALEQACDRQRFAEAVALLPDLLERVNSECEERRV